MVLKESWWNIKSTWEHGKNGKIIIWEVLYALEKTISIKFLLLLPYYH